MWEGLSRQREQGGKRCWGVKELGKVAKGRAGLHQAEPCRLEGVRSHWKVLQKGKNRWLKALGGPPSPHLFDLNASFPLPATLTSLLFHKQDHSRPLLPWVLRTGCSLCLEHFPPKYPHGFPPHLSIFAQMIAFSMRPSPPTKFKIATLQPNTGYFPPLLYSSSEDLPFSSTFICLLSDSAGRSAPWVQRLLCVLFTANSQYLEHCPTLAGIQ